MIISMSNLICITNRTLCQENFLNQIKKIAQAHPQAIVLREKDLSADEYAKLAQAVLTICKQYTTPCILHSFVKIAISLNCHSIHLPLHILRNISMREKNFFQTLGASCHSVEEATEAEKLGCTYITAGHIFNTDCKKGMPGRGIDFLQAVCQAVHIPVYAIGGISKNNYHIITKTSAQGACCMSGFMICKNANDYINEFQTGDT